MRIRKPRKVFPVVEVSAMFTLDLGSKGKRSTWGDSPSSNPELKTQSRQLPRGTRGKMGASEGVGGFTGASAGRICVDNGNERASATTKRCNR
jgi:hypothetical protein